MNKDEVKVTSATGGVKASKLCVLGDIDPRSLTMLGEVAGYGREKYAQYNYLLGYDWSLCYNAAMRHMMLFWAGEDLDDETGLPHTVHAAWHMLALTAFRDRDIGIDDRPSDDFVKAFLADNPQVKR